MGQSLTINRLDSKKLDQLCSATHFTAAEIKDWLKLYSKSCPKEGLGREQFAKLYGGYFSSTTANNRANRNEAFASLMFDAFDSDHNGIIDFEEFLTAISITTRGDAQEKLTCTPTCFY